MRCVDVALVRGDHVPSRLFEAAREAAGACEQVDPERLPLRVLDDLTGSDIVESGPVGT